MTDASNPKSPKKQFKPKPSKKQIKQKGWVLDCTNLQTKKLDSYNAKKDKHLENYFIYFNNSQRLGGKKGVSKSQRCKLPGLGNNSLSHENFQKYLNQKADQTKRNFDVFKEQVNQ